MAAEIKPMTCAASSQKTLTSEKPNLLSKIDSPGHEVFGVHILSQGRSILSISDDRSVRIWQQRANGQFWPSVCHYLSSPPTSLHYTASSRTLIIGLHNGTVMEFEVAPDENSLNHLRDYLSHQGRVTGVLFSGSHSWILSISRDKFFSFHSTTTGHRLGGYECGGWCSSMEFDAPTSHVFVGDYTGVITMLKLDAGSCTLVTTLRGHTSCVSGLAWDGAAQQLFSGSHDHSVMVWDVGGGKGAAYELQGHTGKVRGLKHCSERRVLVSGGEDGMLVWWDMACSRLVTPEWSESDNCQYCGRPFFWNVKAMINQKQLGLRQHHCRKCGKAVCDSCSSRRTNIPAMGFEFNVRVCERCYETISDQDKESLAVFHEAKHPVTAMAVDLECGSLVTVGTDNVIKIWDVKPLLNN
ncbi:WD repeat and FYVE domain-containing protein 2 isoform X2 [Hyalella azteca]|uniref:WD repeat and FYVE domain-containing protein 2 isoform X2 n=1 Tax=Hyalella azteca TaxID=294128 RepID=A0A8B7N6C5_HYAAZ|nr:WD repeat and FYVE domain-containing protein 2 isoform X2 [Hyalella azteca]